MGNDGIVVTEEDWAEARSEAGTIARNAAVGGVVLVAVAYSVTGVVLRALTPSLGGLALVGVGTGVAAVLSAPLLWWLARTAQAKGLETGSVRVAHDRAMRVQAKRREFETRLARALEMVQDEVGAFDVLQRAMGRIAPESPVELLLADNSHAHLERMVTAAPDGESTAGCMVDSPDQCEAARRAQTQVFRDSEELDACPMLRGRPQGRCSAVCVPVSIMGRTVGVVHTTGVVDEPLNEQRVQALQTLANQAGNRIGMLRVMAETQVQASTDGLTGLINRRSLENRVRLLRTEGVDFSFVMADLDHFKDLNDANGHEAGDRALRIFAEALRHELRVEDLACRYGGEEFAVVLPRADAHEAIEAMGRVRERLMHATSRGDTPTFTASFGVAHSSDAADLDDLVQRADRALFAAKDAGRDRICLDGHDIPIARTLTAL
ncbi:MAG TPA: GGDEF domain-containing protein [Acidimicrobiia bacterium]|nr:GGDEF domain-containing protein [Acidimicrobiia bacterium]